MINTYSKFYYINPVDDGNFYLNFNEGSGELTAEIETASYTPTDLAEAVEAALNDTGVNTYTVTFNRSDRTYTIASTVNFSLLTSTGSNVGSDIFSLLGFTGADRTGASTYTGNVAGAFEYEPQFKLQSFVDQEDLQKAVSASINKSASGSVEVVKFGTEKFFEFNLMFITDIDQGVDGPIKTNLSGVSDVRQFLRFAIEKHEIEFIPDVSDVATFYKVLLESTDEDKNGTGYRLKELYAKGLPGYFESGKLVFRYVE
jgi:hypothetical protein